MHTVYTLLLIEKNIFIISTNFIYLHLEIEFDNIYYYILCITLKSLNGFILIRCHVILLVQFTQFVHGFYGVNFLKILLGHKSSISFLK